MMWMMGYNHAGADFDTIQDPLSGRKLRPLVPRPATLPSIHTTDLLSLNHHLAMAAEQNKIRSSAVTNNHQVVVSSRWNPTPEQLQTLEELYRSGTRTPSAEQIQHITGELRKYGKIEGKNVFYWFQNHKARERQKRRRQQLESLSDEPQKKELPPGPNKTAFEVEQTKNWASPTNSSTLPEKTTGEAECDAAEDDIDVAELQQQQRRNATWQMMHHLSYCSPSSSSAFSPPTTTTNNNYSNRHLIIPCSSSSATSPTITMNHPSNPQLDHFVHFFTKPYTSYNLNHHHLSELEDSQTLQLFPLESGLSDQCDQEEEEEEEEEEDDDDDDDDGQNIGGDDHDDQVAPYQFFEFLPLKN